MPADLTAAAAASAAAGATTAVLTAWLGLDVQSVVFGMAGAALGLTFVPGRLGTAQAVLALLGFSIGGAAAGTLLAQHSWFGGYQAAAVRNLLSMIAAAAGHPLLILLLTKVGPAAAAALDKFPGVKR